MVPCHQISVGKFRKYAMANAILSTKSSDRCVHVRDGNIVLIENSLEQGGVLSICGKVFTAVKNLYKHPLPSSDLLIYEAGGLSDCY